MSVLTADYARQLIEYQPDTGAMVWKHRPRNLFPSNRAHKVWNARYAGQACGSVDSRGYLRVSITCGGRKKPYWAHRIAWLITYGKWPEGQIDHINRDGSDNRIDNLRDVPAAENMRNVSLRQGTSSAYRGVSWAKNMGRWHAYIKIQGSRETLGYFHCEDDAGQAVQDAELKTYGFLLDPPVARASEWSPT